MQKPRFFLPNSGTFQVERISSGISPDTAIYLPYNTAEKNVFRSTGTIMITAIAEDLDRVKTVMTDIQTVKVVDKDCNVQSNADGLMEKTFTVTVKTGFFDKVKAFFLGLFGLLPNITHNP